MAINDPVTLAEEVDFGSFTDAAGDFWSLSSTQTNKYGAHAVLLNGHRVGWAAEIELGSNGNVYVVNTFGTWGQISDGGAYTTLSGDPNTISPDNSVLTYGNGTALVTSSGVWNFSPQTNQYGANYLLLNGKEVSVGVKLQIGADGNLYDENAFGAWFQWNGSSFASSSAPPTSSPAISTTVFTVSGGRIFDPNGNVWRAEGVAVYAADVQAYGAGLASTLQSEFPGINLVRLAVGNFSYSPASYAAFVDAATKAGIAVVFEDHNMNQTVLTGSALTAESNWYAGLASYYASNPYVLFQTMNEPGDGDSAQQQATYNAIRGAGNNNLIFMEGGTGAGGVNIGALDPSVYAAMHNVAWDLHAYDWQSNYSTDVATIEADQAQRISVLQGLTSADGVMPVISLETGQATNGTTIDPGGAQEIQATYTNPSLVGAAGWAWDNWGTPGEVNSLTNSGGGSLTSYGQQVASYIQQNSAAAPPIVVSGGSTSSSTIDIRVSEDAWQGDAQFTVSVDGMQVGGTYTAHALHSSNDSEVVSLVGNWDASKTHAVSISFINDASGGTTSSDRNLYVDSIAMNGTTYAGTTQAFYSNGTNTVAVGGATSQTAGPTDELVLHLSEDAFQGDAQFVLTLDGQQITTPQSVTALHSLGQSEDFRFTGNLGGATSSHTVGINFINDAYGGSSTADRNLYVNSVTYDNQIYASGGIALYSNGIVNVIV